jgi:hypothetical protein
MIWQLLQVGYLKDRPLILLGDMWTGVVEWMNREMVPQRYIKKEDLSFVSPVSSIEEALKIIKVAKEKFDRSMDVLYAAGGPS